LWWRQEPVWALLGTSNFKSVELPKNIKQVILAPDGDDAGQAVIRETATRLAGQGREVRAAKLPAGKDWCDVLDDYEERAAIVEFEFEYFHPEAEDLARREAIG
jgi:DNA primase